MGGNLGFIPCMGSGLAGDGGGGTSKVTEPVPLDKSVLVLVFVWLYFE